MTTTNSSNPEQRATDGTEPDAPLSIERERVRELLQREIDKLGPLEDTRRAAVLIGETSIRLTAEPETPGFVIVGPDGQPRMSVEDGHPAAFTLRDLAVELRKSYPTLFHPAASPDASAPASERKAVPAPRDWLMVGSGDPEPRAQADVPAAAPAEVDARQDEPARQDVTGETSTGLQVPTHSIKPSSVEKITATVMAFRPSYAIYAGLAILVCIALAFIVSSLGSDSAPSSATGQQATARPQAGPPSPEKPAPAQASSAARPPLAVTGVPEVVDTTTLNVDGKIVRLFGVEWERGAQAEDLTRYIAGREVTCAPAVRSDRYRCQIEGRDLSEVILYNGGGRATHEATPELKAAEEKARASGVGVWQKP